MTRSYFIPFRSLAADRLCGLLLTAVTLLIILRDWNLAGWAAAVLPWPTLALILLLAVQVRWSRSAFVLVGAALSAISLATNPDGMSVVVQGLASAAFIGAFFAALGTLREAADTSPAITACGTFLAQQPPGRRYIALTIGGQLFALLLNYGSIALLGSLAMANARQETNAEIRNHRIRRMLLAVQRGFISTLPWSPLSFSVAITTNLIPGASWGDSLLPCLVTGAIIAGLGWAMDSIFKPKLTAPAPARSVPEGSWSSLLPLLVLLGVLATLVSGLHAASGVRVAGVVTAVVPLVAMAWIGLQSGTEPPLRRIGRRVRAYIGVALPGFRGELTLLMMAGFIGTVGSSVLAPIVAGLGIDLSVLPAVVILVALVSFIPITGQLGMNPILTVSLFAPLLPSAQVLGITPTAIMVAITAGWALSGISSPYTATTLLTGNFAGISALHVGLRWNGAYTLLCAVVLSGWVLLYTTLS